MRELPMTAAVPPVPESVAEKAIPARVPTWNTPEFPAERPREEEMLAGRHQLIVVYLIEALVAILRKWNRPFEVVTERGLYFQLEGRWRHCDPDVMVLPFELEGDGAVRRGDMPVAPLCVFEVSSPETVNKDLVQKKKWYAEMGIAEYWMVDPVSEPTKTVRMGAILDGGPLQGWQLGPDGRYLPLSVTWREEEGAWVGYSPVLRHELTLSQELHDQHRDGGLRLREPETKVPVRSHEEMLEDHETLRSDHEVLATSYRDAIADREALIFNLVAATFDQDTAQRMRVFLERAGATLPDAGLIMAWLAEAEGPQFLTKVRRHCGLPDEE